MASLSQRRAWRLGRLRLRRYQIRHRRQQSARLIAMFRLAMFERLRGQYVAALRGHPDITDCSRDLNDLIGRARDEVLKCDPAAIIDGHEWRRWREGVTMIVDVRTEGDRIDVKSKICFRDAGQSKQLSRENRSKPKRLEARPDSSRSRQ